MSFSNRDTAIRLFADHNRDVEGSNLYVRRANNPSPNNPFYLGFREHSRVVSYHTEIARLMEREDGGFELWLTTHRYSPTTDRHIHWITNALHIQNSHPSKMRNELPKHMEPIAGTVPCYRVPLAPRMVQGQRVGYLSGVPVRYHPVLLSQANETARTLTRDADLPRLHEATRYAHLANAENCLTQALFIATDCLPTPLTRATLTRALEAQTTQPTQSHHLPTLYAVVTDLWEQIDATLAHLAHVQYLRQLPLDEMRATVRAVNTLTKYN